MIVSCQLGIMGVNVDKFNPNGEMSRAEFWTVLSRILRGNTYNTEDEIYYQHHLQQLQKIWIMNDISSPHNKEIRGYVMLMLMRTGQNLSINHQGS
jgi:hypothetical protein